MGFGGADLKKIKNKVIQECVNSDLSLPLNTIIYAQTLQLNLNSDSLDWVYSLNTGLGEVINDILRINNSTLKQCDNLLQIFNNVSVLNEVMVSTNLLDLLLRSPYATRSIFQSELAIDKIFSSSIFIEKVVHNDIALDCILNNPICVEKLINNAEAMNIIVTSENMMLKVSNSALAVDALNAKATAIRGGSTNWGNAYVALTSKICWVASCNWVGNFSSGVMVFKSMLTGAEEREGGKSDGSVLQINGFANGFSLKSSVGNDNSQNKTRQVTAYIW